LAAGAGHVAGGTTANLFAGQSLYKAFANSFKGIGKSMAIGGAIGIGATAGVMYASGINPWTGEVLASKTGVQYTKSSLKLGQEMHKAYKVDADGIKEFRLPSGKRIDFLDINNGTLYELKPFNPRGIQMGTKQLNTYMQKLQTMPRFQGYQWTTVLDFY
jgi:hypothetical protein